MPTATLYYTFHRASQGYVWPMVPIMMMVEYLWDHNYSTDMEKVALELVLSDGSFKFEIPKAYLRWKAWDLHANS